MSLVKQELATLPEHLSSPPVFSDVRVTRSLVVYACFVDRCLSFFPFFSFCELCCLFFTDYLFSIFTLFLINISKHYQIRGGIFRPCLSVRTSYLDIIHVNSDLPLWGIGIKIIGSVTYLYHTCVWQIYEIGRYLSLYISFLLFGHFFLILFATLTKKISK